MGVHKISDALNYFLIYKWCGEGVFIIFIWPFITETVMCGWDDKSDGLTPPWSFFPVHCSFRDWKKHRTNYKLCRGLRKVKNGNFSLKTIKNFRMATAEHEAKSWSPWSPGPCAKCTGYTPMTLSWGADRGEERTRHTVILFKNYMGSQIQRKKYLWLWHANINGKK